MLTFIDQISAMMIKTSITFLCLVSLTAMAQKPDTVFLKQLMRSHPEKFATVLDDPEKHQVQILYTQVLHHKNKQPTFKSYSFNLNDHHYFYPASTVKLAAVVFALEKINELNIKGLSAKSTMITDSSYNNQTTVIKDTTAQNGLPSIEHYIKKILLTSDNDAFNRLFEFIGRAEINEKLKKYGLNNSRILNRLAIGDAGEPSKHTNPIRFYEDNELIYKQKAQYDPKEYPIKLTNTIMGKAYLDSADQLVNRPFSLENKNAFPISDQHSLMKRLMLPQAFPVKHRFNLTKDDYQLIYKFMSDLPTESIYPKYDVKEFWPTYAKMLYYGREKDADINTDLKIYNKYGDSYGFIIDNAYFKNSKKGIEFFLTAVVQSNKDGIYNDGIYEYESICYPFMKNLGTVIYELELSK